MFATKPGLISQTSHTLGACFFTSTQSFSSLRWRLVHGCLPKSYVRLNARTSSLSAPLFSPKLNECPQLCLKHSDGHDRARFEPWCILPLQIVSLVYPPARNRFDHAMKGLLCPCYYVLLVYEKSYEAVTNPHFVSDWIRIKDMPLLQEHPNSAVFSSHKICRSTCFSLPSNTHLA